MVGKVLAPFSVHVDQGSGSSHDVLSKARTQNSHILTATHKGFLPHPKDDRSFTPSEGIPGQVGENEVCLARCVSPGERPLPD